MSTDTNGHPPWAGAVTSALETNRGRPGPLLPILHDIQSAIGHIPEDAVPAIANDLNLSRAEVHGVVSFYHDFRTQPPGRHIIKICSAESCQAVGSDTLVRHACKRLGIEMHQTTADQAITLEPVYCLGNCALSPALIVDGEVHGRLTPEKLDLLMADLRRKT
jgi:formate dehydrogenase subunit gamma